MATMHFLDGGSQFLHIVTICTNYDLLLIHDKHFAHLKITLIEAVKI